jgi:hypothetical protein
MFDPRLHHDRRQPKNRLRRISIEADRQMEEQSISRWLNLADEVIDPTEDNESSWSELAA